MVLSVLLSHLVRQQESEMVIKLVPGPNAVSNKSLFLCLPLILKRGVDCLTNPVELIRVSEVHRIKYVDALFEPPVFKWFPVELLHHILVEARLKYNLLYTNLFGCL